jgi:TonB family protein
MNHMRTPLTFLVAALPLFAAAEEPAASAPVPASAPAASKPVKIRAVSLRPADPGYPAELAGNGVQGTTDVLINVSADGTPTDVSVQSTSRSAELDRAAVVVAKGLKFTVKDPAKPIGELLVPIEFMRDSVATLSKKTCSEFNVDVAYFKTTFPELETRKMTVINMTVGSLVTLGASGLSQDKLLLHIKKLEAAAKAIVEACAQHPEAGYLKTFTGLVKESGG